MYQMGIVVTVITVQTRISYKLWTLLNMMITP
jgi:hypothetical protein